MVFIFYYSQQEKRNVCGKMFFRKILKIRKFFFKGVDMKSAVN